MNNEPASRRVSWCLVGLIVSLLMVGFVSHTPIRHAIQVTPACLVAALTWRGASWSRFAALPVFLIWLLLMILIWLYLLGIAHVISGTFSGTEIPLTIAIGLAAIAGTVFVFRNKDSLTWAPRLIAFFFGAALQVAALWLSFQPGFARR
ncbi:MAG TPA: hypothetical protein VMT75_04995 [Candidatus Saccharimonadales bacterium]|nr:hypothetical protein [Candidatus Saccharimonadales bacterium]